MMNDAGHLFKSLLVMCISSLEPCVIKSFTHQHVLLLKSEEKKKGFKHPSGLSQWDFRHRGCAEPSAIALRLLKALAWALQAAHVRGSGVQGCCCRDRRNGALLTYGCVSPNSQDGQRSCLHFNQVLKIHTAERCVRDVKGWMPVS